MDNRNWNADVMVAPQCPKCGANLTVFEGEDVCTECTGFIPSEYPPEPEPEAVRPAPRKRTATGRQQRQTVLVRRAKAGDREALNEVVKDVSAFVYGIANRYGRAFGADADDLAQAGLMRVVAAVRTWTEGGRANFLSYAGAAAAREIVRQARRAARGRRTVSLAALVSDPAAPGVELEAVRERVENALDDLGWTARLLIEGTTGVFGGPRRTAGEFGAVLGLSPERAEAVHTGAVAQLRSVLRPLVI